MDAMEAILTRRSIRQYTGEPVTDGEIRQVIKAGSHAPSAHNRQPWHFVVVRDPELILRVAEVHPYAKMAPQAGSCIVVCGDTACQEEVGFLVEDCSAAIENMLIAARSMGLGTVWCGLHPIRKLTDAMRAFLSLPETIIPVGLVVIGHPAENRIAKDRYDEAKVHWDKWA
jgi:nitroreductase